VTPRDPLARLAVAALAIAVVTLAKRPATAGWIFALTFLLLVGPVRVPVTRILRGLLPFAFFAVATGWIYAAAPDAAHRAAPGSGWNVAILVAARTMTVGLVSLGFVMTTPTAALARALVHRAGLSRRFVYGAVAAVQFLPALADDVRMVRLVARAALPAGRGWLRDRFSRWFAGLGPGTLVVLLAGAMRRANAAALSLEVRGIGAPGPATAWRVDPFQIADAWFMALAGLSLAAIVAFT
jgi:energy-coupling factor transport system permease protein